MPAASSLKIRIWTARTLTGLAVAFLLFDCVVKVLKLAPAIEGTTALGYPANSVMWLGLVQLACLVLYVVPRTAVLGAVLLSGYLGGAIASQVRVGNPLFTHVLFPTYIAVLVWGGLYLRNEQLRRLIPAYRAT